MMKKLSLVFVCGLLLMAPFAWSQTESTAKVAAGQAKIKVLVVYYSATGNTLKMAKAVVEGALKIPGVEAEAKTTGQVAETDLKTADAIILGSPTYYGNMAGPMKSFIDDWWLKYQINLTEKVGGAFSTGGSDGGGKEQVVHSLVTSLMNAGMIIVGPLEGPFGLPGATALDPVSDAALKQAGALGERIAGVASRLRK
jgi:NAD(P)H dehydrogenase (quinone)